MTRRTEHGGDTVWWVLVLGALVGATVAGALTSPLLTGAAALGLGLLGISVRWPRATALGAMIIGPLFLSGFTVGPLTLDNAAVLYGTGVAALWLLARRARMPYLAAWPVSLAIAAGLSAAANGGAGATGVMRFVSLAVLAIVLANSAAAVRTRTAVWTEAAATLGALVLLAQPFTGFPDPFGTSEGVGERYGGLFGHPNFAAYTVALVVLYQVYAKPFTVWRMSSTGTLLLALVLTGSRAALLVFVLLLIPALWMRAGRFFALLTPAALALPIVGTTIITRVQSISETGGLSGDNAAGWRLQQWQDALAATRGHEFFGIGWGQTTSVLTDELGVHNNYLEIWLELGRLGTVIAVIGMAVFLRSTRGSQLAWILLIYAAITSVSDPVLTYPSCLTVLLILLSQLTSPDEQGRDSAVEPGNTVTAPPAPQRPRGGEVPEAGRPARSPATAVGAS